MVPEGQHNLRTQFDRLRAKYGDDFANTSQGQQLLSYLSGVSVNKGGGMGAPDPTFGTGVQIEALPAGLNLSPVPYMCSISGIMVFSFLLSA